MTLYIKTTSDKYELPIAVETSAALLAKRLGLKANSIGWMCNKDLHGFHKVVVEDDEKGEEE